MYWVFDCWITWRYIHNIHTTDKIIFSYSAYISEKWNIISWNYIGLSFGYTKTIALTKLRDHVGEHLFEILEFNYVTFCVIWCHSWQKFPMHYIYKLVTVALIMATYRWEEIFFDIVGFSMFYMCDSDRTYNSIIKMPWCHLL